MPLSHFYQFYSQFTIYNSIFNSKFKTVLFTIHNSQLPLKDKRKHVHKATYFKALVREGVKKKREKSGQADHLGRPMKIPTQYELIMPIGQSKAV